MNREPLKYTLARGLIAIALGLLVLGLAIGLVYAFYDQFTERGRHWANVILSFGLVVAFAIGVVVGRASGHRQGYRDAQRDRSDQPAATVVTTPARRDYQLPLFDTLPDAPRHIDERALIEMLDEH